MVPKGLSWVTLYQKHELFMSLIQIYKKCSSTKKKIMTANIWFFSQSVAMETDKFHKKIRTANNLYSNFSFSIFFIEIFILVCCMVTTCFTFTIAIFPFQQEPFQQNTFEHNTFSRQLLNTFMLICIQAMKMFAAKTYACIFFLHQMIPIIVQLLEEVYASFFF